jgi:hypothetical protein
MLGWSTIPQSARHSHGIELQLKKRHLHAAEVLPLLYYILQDTQQYYYERYYAVTKLAKISAIATCRNTTDIAYDWLI